MKQLFIWCIPGLFFACKDRSTPQAENKPAEAATSIFPVSSFFNQQIREVDSLQLPTVKYTIAGGRRDTVSITMEEFKKLAAEFTESDISKPSVSGHYKETNFADQSIPSVTLTYSTSNITLAVQRMDVILDPNPVLDDKVKTVYIEKKQMIGDTLINKKLYWKSHKNFQVFTGKQVTGRPEIITQVKVAWDNSDEF